ncbi:glucagon family neuropeptides-like [Limosa lapponica baueri]|uniref:Glucagon family neuropeptides-like n=1 Tax=Limosa lapponica baueri TaxID=1758121 RepID=A0A2I0TF57_LIMLA|nr:glucagon family neuropeptides-like [Limosa lapponica baueri]
MERSGPVVHSSQLRARSAHGSWISCFRDALLNHCYEATHLLNSDAGNMGGGPPLKGGKNGAQTAAGPEGFQKYMVFSFRSQRHSDGLFTSEYSKMRGNAQVQKFIQNLMGRKRSSPGPVNTDVQGREKENSHEELCFMWLYQSFLNTSHSDSDAREAAAITSQYVCPISKHLVADMKEDTDSFD